MSIDNKNHTQLSDEDLANLKTYGALSPQEFAPDDEELLPGQCVCGAFKCSDEYAHTTSGY
jgi:hypothetical protein